jgi:hypothetical protein
MKTFREELIEQRWDDHRFYHHSLVNQSLHFVSACTFLTCYALLFVDPAVASLLGLDGGDVDPPVGPFLLRAQELRQRQRRHSRI